jgi:arylsulfatase A-like enzyme
MEMDSNMQIYIIVLFVLSFWVFACTDQNDKQVKPNIIFIMADDLGYGDVGFMGNQIIQTPNLDDMAKNGVVFNRFYAGAAVCSPTRGTCLTGRHHYRYGIFTASAGYLPDEEITLARMCKEEGYVTGHFGKWHLAPLTKSGQTMPEYYEKREQKYAPPWERDYDQSFVTECNTPTWNPLDSKRFDKDSQLGFLQNGKDVTENMDGAAAKIVMDRAIPFMQNAVKQGKPFMTTIWFLEPHDPVVAGPEHKAIYSEYSDDEQHYYGCITAMDEQIGRLRHALTKMGIDKNTMVWFCSDNGPAHLHDPGSPVWWMQRSRGDTGGLRARKRSFFEGGIRVPALLEWPGHIEAGKIIDVPASTLDYFPTIQTSLNYQMPDDRPIDGIDLMPLILGEKTKRLKPIPFCKPGGGGPGSNDSPKFALIDNNLKLLTNLSEGGEEDLLFDLEKDRAEENNIIEDHPEIASKMKSEIREWIKSFKMSHSGADYGVPFKPVNEFPEIFEEK